MNLTNWFIFFPLLVFFFRGALACAFFFFSHTLSPSSYMPPSAPSHAGRNQLVHTTIYRKDTSLTRHTHYLAQQKKNNLTSISYSAQGAESYLQLLATTTYQLLLLFTLPCCGVMCVVAILLVAIATTWGCFFLRFPCFFITFPFQAIPARPAFSFSFQTWG